MTENQTGRKFESEMEAGISYLYRVYGIYVGPKGVHTQLLRARSIYHTAMWILWATILTGS